ncbi:MAG: tetratricopeptide repeat protein, partial [Nitrospirae bacterium]
MDAQALRALRLQAQRLLQAGDPAAAIEAYRRLCAASGGDATLWLEMGAACGQAGRLEEARRCFERAIELRPELAEAHTQLGLVDFFQGRVERAIERYEHALSLRPDDPNTLCNLAFALDRVGRLGRAIAEYRRAHRLRPSVPVLHSIGHAHLRLGEVEAALEAFREAAELGGGDAESLGNLAFALNYRPGVGREELFEAHRRWGAALRRQVGPPAGPGPRREAGGRLRVGYVSGDFRTHSVAYFAAPLLAHHDRERVAVYAYANVAQPDGTTERLRGLCDRWVDISRMNDAQAAARIRSDRIDILVDLSGLTRGNRLRLFAMRPAPVQVT